MTDLKNVSLLGTKVIHVPVYNEEEEESGTEAHAEDAVWSTVTTKSGVCRCSMC